MRSDPGHPTALLPTQDAGLRESEAFGNRLPLNGGPKRGWRAGAAQPLSQAVQKRTLPALLLLSHPPPTRPGLRGIPSFLLTPSSCPPFPAPAGGPWGWRLLLPEGGSQILREIPSPSIPQVGAESRGLLAPLHPSPKASGLAPGCEWGFGESEKAPFLLWALKPFAGNTGGGRGWRDSPPPSILSGAYSVQCRLPQFLLGNRTPTGPKGFT